jgi:hypothetical protein
MGYSMVATGFYYERKDVAVDSELREMRAAVPTNRFLSIFKSVEGFDFKLGLKLF